MVETRELAKPVGSQKSIAPELAGLGLLPENWIKFNERNPAIERSVQLPKHSGAMGFTSKGVRF